MKNILWLILPSFLFTGCGVLIGNVRPVTEKSERYTIHSLAQENSQWVELKSEENESKESEESDQYDLAFQSKKTASVISINSACRVRLAHEKKDLRKFTDLLILGFNKIEQRDEREIQIDQEIPALETTIKGELNQNEMMMRAVVLKKEQCIYDLMYIARPGNFKQEEKDFSNFVTSLKLH